MKIQSANEFILNKRLGDPTECVYQFIFDENDSNDTKIIQYFIMHGQRLCIKFYSLLANMFYTCSLIYNTAVPITINKNKYFISLNTNNIVFSWGAGNKNKNTT